MINTYSDVALSLLRNGYEPVPIEPGQKKITIAGWSTVDINENTVRNWCRSHSKHGVGIRTTRNPAIDIDILDPVAADLAAEAVVSVLGTEPPMRVGQAPKRLFICRTDTPFRKLRREYVDDLGEIHAVEILGQGQQFVAYNIHPVTKKPFMWGLDEPTSIASKDLPLLTPEIVMAVLRAIDAALIKHGWSVVKAVAAAPTAAAPGDPLLGHKQKAQITTEKVDSTLDSIPNTLETHYDTWAMIGMALWHQFDGSDEGFERWVEWSEKGPKHNAEAMRLKWRSFAPSGVAAPVTFASVLRLASTIQAETAEAEHKQRIARIATAATPIELAEILKDVRKTELSPLHREDVINKFVKAYKRLGLDASKVSIKKELLSKKPAKNSIIDLESALADKVLAEQFDGGDTLLSIGGECWIYDNGVWRLTDEESVRLRVLRVLQTMKEAKDPDYMKLLQAAQEAKRDDRMAALVNTVTDIMLLQRTKDSHTDPLNLRGGLYQPVVNCRNGELWITEDGTIEFRNHFAANYLTAQLACDYDPLADCPLFASALHKAFSRCREPEEVIRHWLEVMGMVIQPVRAEAFWVLMKGPGGNGKSFLMEVISRLIGNSTYAGAVSDLGGRNGVNTHFTASLVGKLLFLDDDLKTGTILPDDWLKKLSEPKLLTANPKYARPYEFTSRAIAVVLTNPWPSTSDVSVGMQRRAQVFEMTNVLDIAERDPALVGKIVRDELPGVLNLLLSGLVRVLQRGHRFDPPDECVEARQHWLNAGNPTARFMDERVKRVPRGTSRVSLEALYEEYKKWVYDCDDHVKMLGRNAFYQVIENSGFEIGRASGGRYTYAELKDS